LIPRQELLDLATDFGLQPNVVEKDYALGWLLAGIGEHAATRDTWVFKGGTCLKKCFFETYRFSEDLDFTLLDHSHLDEAFLKSLFDEIAAWVYEQAGLVLPPDARKVEVLANPRGGTSAEGRIGYRGPLGRGGDAPRVKLDLTDDEKLVQPVDRREVHHPYSDRPADGIQVSTYCFEEVFAEKLCALA
jgi:predicted nucleotidyltransferase component of viral defense system